jgi:hypothetical protein
VKDRTSTLYDKSQDSAIDDFMQYDGDNNWDRENRNPVVVNSYCFYFLFCVLYLSSPGNHTFEETTFETTFEEIYFSLLLA